MLEEKKITINSILLGILFSIKIIIFNTNNSQLMRISIFVIFTIMTVINLKSKINVKTIVFCSFIGLVYFYIYINERMFGNNTYLERNITCFIVYGIFAFLIMDNKFNIRMVINTIIILYLVNGYSFIRTDFNKYLTGDLMAISYDLVPLFCALIIKYWGLKEKFTKKSMIMLLLMYPYIYFLLVYCSRGVYLSCLVCIILCQFTQKLSKKKLFLMLIIVIIVSIILLNILNILTAVNNFLLSKNLSFKIIEKNVRLMQDENIDNGRSNLYSIALEEINNNFIIGKGIGRFNLMYGTYPHNFILQIMYEGGIVFLIPMIIPIIYGIYVIIWKKDVHDNMKLLLVFLFSISIVRLTISYEFWKEVFFWMYLSAGISAMLNTNLTISEEKNDKCYYTNIQKS